MTSQRGKVLAGTLILTMVLAAVAVGVWRFRPRTSSELDQLFQSTLSEIEQGNTKNIEVTLSLLDADPAGMAQAGLLRGLLLLRAGRFQESLNFLDRVPVDGPLVQEVFRYQGEALCRMGRPVEAQVPLLKLLRLFPDDSEGLRWLAVSYYDIGAYEPARHYLTRLLEARPDDLSAHRLMGLMYYDFSELADAITHYRKVLELSPPEDVRLEVTQELADSLIGMREFEEAKGLLKKLSPPAARTTLLLARCEFGLGDNDEALRLLDTIPEESRLQAQYYLLKGDLLSAMGNDQNAKTALEEGVAGLPFDTELRYRYGLQLQKLGLQDQAAEHMARWNELNELSKQLTELNLKAVGDPADVEVRQKLAEVCRKLGKTELAEMWMQSAAEAQRLRPVTDPQ